MCGVAGFSGHAAFAMAAAAGALAHRGPDASGSWRAPDGAAGLVHTRLSIIDPSPEANQPMVDAAGQLVLVFNGEIYNFRELRGELESRGHVFRSRSDTEVLLALYRERGEAMLPLLNGIFAFAIYDARDRSLFLAGDAMAVKPLYVAERDGAFWFASELKALLAAGLKAAIDPAVLLRCLGFLWSPGGATPLQGIRRLEPGEALRVVDGRVARRWRWAPPAWGDPVAPVRASGAVGQVRDALRAAVGRQLVSDVPVGAFLSGGLDSSAVVAMARETAPGIECFTIDAGSATDPGMADDLPYARRVAAHLGVRLHEVQVDSSRMAADLERMVFQLDEPLADPAPLNVLYISALARRHGVKVLLSGAGGDDLFTGYRRHRALMLERWWAWLPAVVRQRLAGATAGFDQSGALGRRLGRAFAHAGDAPRERLIGYFQWLDPQRAVSLFAREHRDRLAPQGIGEPMQAYLDTLPAGMPELNRLLALEQRFFLPDHNLLYTDKMSMAAGVEVRVPFLDADLVRLANALPPRMKQRGAEGKWVLKQAMRPYLPREVIHRPKTGFGAPLRQWLRHELREWVADMLSADTLRRRGLFDPAAVARLVDDHHAGRIDAAYPILALVCIEVWCRGFVDGAAPRPFAGA